MFELVQRMIHDAREFPVLPYGNGVAGLRGVDVNGNTIPGDVYQFADARCTNGVCIETGTGRVLTGMEAFDLGDVICVHDVCIDKTTGYSVNTYDPGLIIAGASGVAAMAGMVNPVVGLIGAAAGLFMSSQRHKPGSINAAQGTWAQGG